MTPAELGRVVGAVAETLARQSAEEPQEDWGAGRIPLDHAALFRGRCGHAWIGDSGGWYACPTCGDYDGDHHLRGCTPLAELLPEGS